MDKIFNDIVYELPFLDYNVKNTSIDNKIQIGHPFNPCSVTIIDGLNIGKDKYDSAFIVSCPEYLNNGHSQNFIEDFERRYNLNPILLNIEEQPIQNIIKKIENNNYNIFLKLDICDRKIYNFLSQINSKKYTQIVCTELPIPVAKYEIDILNNYMGLDTSQSILNEIGLKNELNNFKSDHYLVNFTPRWSIKDPDWYDKTKNLCPEFQSVTFLKPEMSNYIKIIDIGNSENPQKNLSVDMNYSANIIFKNEFEIYPDRFSCYIKNEKNQNEIIVSRVDKTRMGWGQKLKAITNIQLLPKTSTCVFVRKDIFQGNRFIPISQNNIPSDNLDINLTTFNTNIEFNNPIKNINHKDFSYWSPINIEGYKRILTKIIKQDFIKQNFETKLIPNEKIQKIINKKKEMRKQYLSLIFPDNMSMVKLLKNIFKSIDIFEQSKSNSDLRSIYISLNQENKQKFKIALLKIILSHIIISEGNTHNTLNNISLDNRESHITVKDKIIKIDRRIKNKNMNIIFTKNYINIKKTIHKKHLQSFLKIKNDLDTTYLRSMKDFNQKHRIIPEILILSKELF
jgi:hypothetical protein